jgi:hypothetical protein
MKRAIAWSFTALWLVSAAASAEATPPQTRLVNEFSAFAGSESNAQSLVTGLRGGSPITLVEPPTPTRPAVETTFVPPTRPMGFGNVSHALVLARADLARHGITDPNTEQIRTALMGGTLINGSGDSATRIRMDGVLQMRAGGMGWGNIAKSMDVKLGHVVSASKPAGTHSPKTPVAVGRDTTGITTAAGANPSPVAKRAEQTRAGPARSGIVTAAGPTAADGASTRGQGNGSSRVVTAAGSAASSNASATGMAHGKGHGKP